MRMPSPHHLALDAEAEAASRSPSLSGPSDADMDNDGDGDGDNSGNGYVSSSTVSTGLTSLEDAPDPLGRKRVALPNVNSNAQPKTSSSTVISSRVNIATRWKLPFVKVSNSSSSSASSSTSVAPGNITSFPPAESRLGNTFGDADDEDDGSYIETTSARAAYELAKYWNRARQQQQRGPSGNGKGKERAVEAALDGEQLSSLASNDNEQQYFVASRVSDGKQIYRIRYL